MYYGLKFKEKEVQPVLSISEQTFGVDSLVYNEYMNRKTLMECLLEEAVDNTERIRLEAQLEVLYEMSIKDILHTIWEKIKKFFSMVKEFIQKVIQKIKGFFKKTTDDAEKELDYIKKMIEEYQKGDSHNFDRDFDKEYSLYKKPDKPYKVSQSDLASFCFVERGLHNNKEIDDELEKNINDVLINQESDIAYSKKFVKQIKDKENNGSQKNMLFSNLDRIISSYQVNDLFFNENDVAIVNKQIEEIAGLESKIKETIKVVEKLIDQSPDSTYYSKNLKCLNQDLTYLQTMYKLSNEFLQEMANFNNHNKRELDRVYRDLSTIIEDFIKSDPDKENLRRMEYEKHKKYVSEYDAEYKEVENTFDLQHKDFEEFSKDMRNKVTFTLGDNK